MAIALKLGGDGHLQQLQAADTLQIDAIDLLSATGTLTIGAGMGAGDDIQLGSATSLVTVLGDGEVDGKLTVSGAAGIELTSSAVSLYRSGNDLMFDDANNTPKTLTELAAVGISESEHEALDTLAHDLAESFYREYTYTGWRVTNVTTWETVSKLKKIREEQITYSSGRISTQISIQYDSSGVESYRMTYTYTYTGIRISSVTAVRS